MEFTTWAKFESLLKGLSVKEGQKGGNNSSPLITPAHYLPNTTRSNKNVDQWGGWAAVDVDDFFASGDIFDIDLVPSLQKICGQYHFACYSTASSTPNYPKFRLVFPLSEIVYADDIPHFWYALNKELQDIGDKQTKDLSRMYYIPGQYNGAFNFIFSNRDASPIDPGELMVKWPYAEKATLNNFFDRLPEEIQNQIIEHRKSKLDNTNIHWSSYRDCPFFPKKLEAEYRLINNTGWYHKMYQIMVAIAGNAIKREYPITSAEISKMCRELDMETGNWYENRPLDKEADRALEYVYKNI